MQFLCSRSSSSLLNTYCLRYITNRVLLEKLTLFQSVKKFSGFYENRNSLTLVTGNLHLAGLKYTQFTVRHPTYYGQF